MPQRTMIAVVDDDTDVLDALDHLLTAWGFRTVLFSSGEQVMGAAAISEAACLVIDIGLGDASGVDVVQQLAANGMTIPVVFMTGSRDDAARQQAMDCGCAAFLQKPFPATLLLEAVAKATGVHV